MTQMIAIAALTATMAAPAQQPPQVPREARPITAAAERIAARTVLYPAAQTRKKDSVGNGILIGAAVGGAADWFVAPRVFCGSPGHDRECEVNVKYILFWPAVAGGALAGWLIDALI